MITASFGILGIYLFYMFVVIFYIKLYILIFINILAWVLSYFFFDTSSHNAAQVVLEHCVAQ
jgi:hypothetical protein